MNLLFPPQSYLVFFLSLSLHFLSPPPLWSLGTRSCVFEAGYELTPGVVENDLELSPPTSPFQVLLFTVVNPHPLPPPPQIGFLSLRILLPTFTLWGSVSFSIPYFIYLVACVGSFFLWLNNILFWKSAEFCILVHRLVGVNSFQLSGYCNRATTNHWGPLLKCQCADSLMCLPGNETSMAV